MTRPLVSPILYYFGAKSDPRGVLPMPDPKRNQPSWLRFSGVGLEFAGAIAVFAAIGYWIDASYGSKPWGLVIGAALGMIGGTYNLIRETIGAFKPPTKPGGPKDGDHGK